MIKCATKRTKDLQRVNLYDLTCRMRAVWRKTRLWYMPLTKVFIRTDRYKLVRFYGEQDNWELFDLQEDPNEVNNIIENKNYTAVLDTLRGKLGELILKYEDKEAEQILRTAGEI